MTTFFETVQDYIRDGGVVMVPLLAATLVLWYFLGYRAAVLRRGSALGLGELVAKAREGKIRRPRGIVDRAVVDGVRILQRYRARLDRDGIRRALDDAFGRSMRDLRKGRVVVQTVVAAAPLAGLLGTVTGMIETFDSLGDAAMFTQSGGIAGGISQALLTTQMGLSIAVPGLIAGRILDKRQDRLRRELAQLEDMLCDDAWGAPSRTREVA